MKKTSQKKQEDNATEPLSKEAKMVLIKKHLKKHRKITPWQAIELYNETRLAAVVFKLKKQGWNIINLHPSGQSALYIYKGMKKPFIL